MAKSEWKIGVTKQYIAYRVLNVNEPVHSGNIEYYGEYSENREEIEKLVDKLNAREAT